MCFLSRVTAVEVVFFYSTVSNAWLLPVNEVVFRRVYRVLFGDTEAEFYLEKTNWKLEGHPFSKVCFQSPVLLISSFYVFKQ